MEAKELRIGNYVNDSTDHCQIDVKCSDLCYSGNFEPIPLTEEWLVKFGFYISNRKDSTITDYVIVKEGFGYFEVFCIDITKGLGFAGCKYKIKHVHQLQNLYFALTGEELTIKL